MTNERPSPSSAPKPKRDPWHRFLDVISSLRLTVIFLCLAVLLVFIGTLAQVEEGLYNAQHRYFRSLFIWWGPAGASWKLPVFPGGYLIGGVLLINLLAAHAKRFTFSKKKIGIFTIHAGLILMLLGQFATDMLSTESAMHVFEGQTKNFSEDFRASELAIIDVSNEQTERVYSVPESRLASKSEVSDPRLPVSVRVKNWWPNADLVRTKMEGALQAGATVGSLKDIFVIPRPLVLDMENRNVPAAVVEILAGGKSLGTFLTYAGVTTRQAFEVAGKPYELSLRFARYYYPFSITVLKATHENYKGTREPKNFASRVRVDNPARNEARETVIYMNNPLRYAGLTFFQYQMTGEELAREASERTGTLVKPSSTFQVVRNPSWLTPYISCIMVAAGLIIQFLSHLIGFVRRKI